MTITLAVPDAFANLQFFSPLIIILDCFLSAFPWLVFFALLIAMGLLLVFYFIGQMEANYHFSFYRLFLGELVLLYFSIFWHINVMEHLTKTGG